MKAKKIMSLALAASMLLSMGSQETHLRQERFLPLIRSK